MGRRQLLNSKEAAMLLGIAVDEDSLIRHLTLDSADRLGCELRRRPQNKLNFAVQLCAMRQTGDYCLNTSSHQPLLPSWNYLVAHAYGHVTVHDDERYVRGISAR